MPVNRLYNRAIYSPWKVSLLHALAPSRKAHPPFAPKRILLCNTGRLGDVFITTRMLARLKDYEVGLLVAKEGKAAAGGCPGVSHVHLIEPWYCSSDAKKEKLKKWRNFQSSIADRSGEFERYDTVFLCNPHYCGIAPLFPNAHTIGFDSHADRKQLSRVLPWNPHSYLGDVYGDALNRLGFPEGEMTTPWVDTAQEPYFNHPYCVLHIGASDATKDYSPKMWRKVYEGLKERGERIVFTGKGQRKQIEAITTNEEEILCDKLSFQELLRVIAYSKLVISVDTVALHVAAAFKRPLIALYRDAPDGATWRPTCQL